MSKKKELRHKLILQILEDVEFILMPDLAKRFGIHPRTIRTDIESLFYVDKRLVFQGEKVWFKVDNV